MSKEAMTLALNVLKTCRSNLFLKDYVEHIDIAIKALKEALAQQEQDEPVGYQQLFDAIAAATNTPYEGAVGISVSSFEKAIGSKIYTTPQPAQKPWVGLTDDERGICINSNFGTGLWLMAKDVEAKLKEKNT